LESEFDALLDAAVDAIVVIDDQSNIVEFNPAAERLFGYERRDVLGQTVDVLMPEPYHSQHEKYVNHYLETGEKRIMGIGREVVGLDKRGEAIPLWLSVGEAVLGDQRRFVGILRDLTGQHAAERERHALETRLARVGRFSLMGEMAAGIAHEINQPLAAIANYAQAARRLFEAPDADLRGLRDACEGISEQVHRAGQVIENLRAFIRKRETEKEPLRLNDVIENVMGLVRADAAQEGIEVHVDYEPYLPEIMGNAVQIQQVLVNLTHNGVEAMEHSLHRDKGLLIETGLAEGHVQFSVTDHGTGVSARLRDAIFHPFVTTKPEGLGVGLAISHTIVRAHGGELAYAENPDGGAVFTVTLPTAAEISE
jgi:two-component system sensor kinase FixL